MKRKSRRIGYLGLGVVLLIIVGGVFVLQNFTSPNLEGHPLVGLWIGESPPSGMKIPHNMILNADGTGMETSGIGNLDCRWEPLAKTGAVVRLQITHVGQSPWKGEPRDVDIELVDPDTIRIKGRLYTRQKQ